MFEDIEHPQADQVRVKLDGATELGG